MIKIKVFDIFQKEYEIHFPSNKVTPYLFIESLKKKEFNISTNFDDIQIISITQDKEIKSNILQFNDNEQILVKNKKFNENFPLIFNAMDKDEKKDIEVEDNKSIPDYLIAFPGINIFGICDNRNCEAYGKDVLANIDENEYDLIEKRHIVKCPICNTNIIGKTIAFYSCYYNYYGTKINDQDQKENFGKRIENFQNIEIPDNNIIKINGQSYEVNKTSYNNISYYLYDETIIYLKLVVQVKKL